MSERANFLSLPPELRIAIYNTVIHASVDIINGVGSKTKPDTMSSSRQGPSYLTPWCALMLTCRQIANELRQHMTKQISLANNPITTWAIELGSSQKSYTTEAKRRRLPCPPIHARVLRLETPLSGLENAWGIARVLIQTVSLVLRRGPSLDTAKPSNPAQLAALNIREIHLAFVGACSESQRRYGLPENVVHCFRTMRREDSTPGAGSIEMIKLIDEYYEQSWWTIPGRAE